jgi:hypothetical protein
MVVNGRNKHWTNAKNICFSRATFSPTLLSAEECQFVNKGKTPIGPRKDPAGCLEHGAILKAYLYEAPCGEKYFCYSYHGDMALQSDHNSSITL